MDEALKADLERLAPDVDLAAARSSFDRRRRARRIRRRAMQAGLLTAVVILTGGLAVGIRLSLGQSSDEVTVADDAASETTNQTTTTSTTSTSIAGSARQWRTFVIDGVEVVAETEFESLPAVVDTVEFATAIIDDGTGPQLCLGHVASSLPPRCEGLRADGLDADRWWSDETGAVRTGERTVVVAWPPQEGAVTVLAHREYVVPSRPELPEGEPTAASSATQERLDAAIADSAIAPFVLSSSHGGDKLEVRVAVADRANLAALRTILPDPDSYRVVSEGALLRSPSVAENAATSQGETVGTLPTAALDEWCGGRLDVDEEIRFRPGAFSSTAERSIVQGQRHRYRLEATAGQQMTVELEPPRGSVSFQLMAPGGEVLAELVTSANVVLPETGEYWICVSPDGGSNTSTTSTIATAVGYQLHTNIIDLTLPDEELIPDVCPAETTGRFNHPNGVDSYSGSLNGGQNDLAVIFTSAGQTLRVWIESPAEEATFTVRSPGSPDNPSGQLLAGASSAATISDVDEGWHQICVTAFGDTTYQLWVELVDP